MSAIEESVIEKIRQRADAGLKKYGVTMEREDLSTREWLVHAQQEAMDLCVYLERAIQNLGAAQQKAEPPKAIDLSKCKKGDRLRRRDGSIIEYMSPRETIGILKHTAGGELYTASGFWLATGRKSEYDIVEVVGQ
jgi:hypothetical protein